MSHTVQINPTANQCIYIGWCQCPGPLPPVEDTPLGLGYCCSYCKLPRLDVYPLTGGARQDCERPEAPKPNGAWRRQI